LGPVNRLRAWWRYREMASRLSELDALDNTYSLGAAPARPLTRRRLTSGPRTQRRLATLFALSMVGLVVVLGVMSQLQSNGDQPATGAALPEPRSDARSDRMRRAVPVGSTGAHTFQQTLPSGRPVSFDPCRPIRFVFNPVGMPRGGAEQLRAAVREIGDATGLEFVDDGVTSEQLVEGRSAVQPDRYGSDVAPVLIAWADEAEFPLLGGDVVGVSTSISASPGDPGERRYVTGTVALDRTWFEQAMADPDSMATARAVLLHELGHLVGLDHVTDLGELMAESGDAVEFGPGDREGLAVLGSGPCLTPM